MSTMSAEFGRQVLAVSIAQMISRLKFGSAETHALDTLVEVTGLFIETIGRRAALLAEHDGRNLVAFEDLLLAFEDLERSIDWKDLKQMCQQLRWDVPFTKGIPDFPIDKLTPLQHHSANRHNTATTNALSSFADTNEAATAEPHGGDTSIPSFFPAFPPPHTYKNTEVEVHVAVADAAKARKRALDIRLQVRSALAKIHKAEALKSTTRKNATGGSGGELFGAQTTDAATLAAAGPGAGSVRPLSSVVTTLLPSGSHNVSSTDESTHSTACVGLSAVAVPQPDVFLKINKAQAQETAAEAAATAEVLTANSNANESASGMVNMFTATPRKVHVGRKTSMMSGGGGSMSKQPMSLERSMTREDRLIDGLEVEDDDDDNNNDMDIGMDGPSSTNAHM